MEGSGEEWQPDPDLIRRVDAASDRWQQGDAFSPGFVVRFTDGDRPLTIEAAEEGIPGLHGIGVEFEQVVIVSQTCDVVRTANERPHVQVSPVVNLDGYTLKDAQRGRRPRYAALPGLGDDAFADLDLCATYEKTILDDHTPRRGCPDANALLAFGRAVARHRCRFAFPDDVVEAMDRLVDRMVRRADRNSPEGRRVDELSEIRASARPAWDADLMSIELTFLVNAELGAVDLDDEITDTVKQLCDSAPSTGQLTEALERADLTVADRSFLWMELVQQWKDLVQIGGRIVDVEATAESEATYTLARYNTSAQLDLDHLSNGPS